MKIYELGEHAKPLTPIDPAVKFIRSIMDMQIIAKSTYRVCLSNCSGYTAGETPFMAEGMRFNPSARRGAMIWKAIIDRR